MHVKVFLGGPSLSDDLSTLPLDGRAPLRQSQNNPGDRGPMTQTLVQVSHALRHQALPVLAPLGIQPNRTVDTPLHSLLQLARREFRAQSFFEKALAQSFIGRTGQLPQ